MQQKNLLITMVLLSFLLLSSSVFADVYIRPAKLGIVRLTIQPLFPTISQGTFDVGNSYDFPLNVTLQASQNISSILTLSEENLTLQPNETQTISYTIKPTESGTYQGSVFIRFDAGTNRTGVNYQDDITIFVHQSDSYILVLIAVAAVVIIAAVSLLVMKKSKKTKREKQ